MYNLISATVAKNKQGRPRRFSEESVRIIKSLFPELKSKRGVDDALWRTYAMQVIGGTEYKWLFDKVGCEAGLNTWKPVLLAELGRIDNAGDIRKCAAELCELKPKTRDGVLMIRRWRLSKDGVGTAKDLAQAMLSAYNDYLMRYPATTKNNIGAALDLLADSISN